MTQLEFADSAMSFAWRAQGDWPLTVTLARMAIFSWDRPVRLLVHQATGRIPSSMPVIDVMKLARNVAARPLINVFPVQALIFW